MEAIIETFGIDARLIVIQLINFGLLLAGLSYFLYRPVMKMLADREEKITQGINDAEAAAEAKASAEADKKQLLGEAAKEAEAVALRAKEHASEKADSIVAIAEEKANGIVKAAEAKSEELKLQAHKESEAEISKLAILAAERVLRKEA